MDAFRRDPLADDSYQYLNVAEHLEHGQGASTSLVHFDSERSHGHIPAPLTTFPPGYPVAILIGSGFSANLEFGGRMVSGMGYVGTTALLVWTLMLTGASALVRQFVLSLFVTNAVNLDFATAVLTEQLFTVMITASIAALIWAERQSVPQRLKIALVLIAYTIAGLAYWVRYAGLFFIAALAGFALIRYFFRRDRLRAVYLAAACIPVALAGLGMIRNLAIAGTWKGGNDLTVNHPVPGVLVNYIQAQVHLLLGLHPVMVGFWECCALVGGLGLVALSFATAWNRRPSLTQLGAMPEILLVLCIFVYSAGLFYAGLRTVITFGTRMFLPLLPLYLLALGMALSWLARNSRLGIRRPWFITALGLFAVGYIGTNARDLYALNQPSRVASLARIYAEPIPDGRPLMDWVQSHILPGDAIASTDGQATGFLLHRSTLSLVRSLYSRERWESDEVRLQMKRFGARYLILYKPSPGEGDPITGESKFVASAIFGPPPPGFKIAAENPDVRILELSGTGL